MADNTTTTTAIIAISGAATAILRTAIKYGCLVFIAYFAYKSIQCLAGKTTLADFAFNFLANVKVQYMVSYGVGGVGIAYGYYQRRLRKSRIKTLSEHVTRLEQHIHPDRSSSNIRPDGTTPPDQLPL